DDEQPQSPIFYDYVFTEEGWRILTALSFRVDPVASGNALPMDLPTTLPSSQRDDPVKSRPCVVSPPEATSFAGLLLRSPQHDERSLIAEIPHQLPPNALDNFDLGGARVASLPFVPSCVLVLLPHRDTRISVPFVVNGEAAKLV